MLRAATPAILALVAAISPSLAQAAEDKPRYELETIVFERVDGAQQTDERWPSDLETPSFDKALEPVPLHGYRQVPVELSDQGHRLGGVAERLRSSPDFRVIVHTAWHQLAHERSEAQPVRVQGGEKLQVPVPFEQLFMTDSGGVQSAAVTYGGERTVREIEGSITLAEGRHLHVIVDMLFRQALARPHVPQRDEPDWLSEQLRPDETDTRRLRVVHLKQGRRVRSGQLHYFDHPLFGVLLIVREHTRQGESRGQQ